MTRRVAARGSGAGMGGGGHANNPTFMFQVSEATVTLRAPAKSATARQFFFGAGAWARGYGGGPTCAHACQTTKAGTDGRAHHLPCVSTLSLAVGLRQEQVEGRRLRCLGDHPRYLGSVEVRLVCAEEGRRVVDRLQRALCV